MTNATLAVAAAAESSAMSVHQSKQPTVRTVRALAISLGPMSVHDSHHRKHAAVQDSILL